MEPRAEEQPEYTAQLVLEPPDPSLGLCPAPAVSHVPVEVVQEGAQDGPREALEPWPGQQRQLGPRSRRMGRIRYTRSCRGAPEGPWGGSQSRRIGRHRSGSCPGLLLLLGRQQGHGKECRHLGRAGSGKIE